MRGHFGPDALLLLIWVFVQCFGMTFNLSVRSGVRDLCSHYAKRLIASVDVRSTYYLLIPVPIYAQ